MQLAEKLILRRYHALDNDWTPLSRNPCWLSNAAHHFHAYMKRNRFVWFHRLVNYRQKLLPTNYKLMRGNDKSFADDLVESGYCKCESSLCATIHWDFSRVATICSSLFWIVNGGLSSSSELGRPPIFLRAYTAYLDVRNSAQPRIIKLGPANPVPLCSPAAIPQRIHQISSELWS